MSEYKDLAIQMATTYHELDRNYQEPVTIDTNNRIAVLESSLTKIKKQIFSKISEEVLNEL